VIHQRSLIPYGLSATVLQPSWSEGWVSRTADRPKS
jgi:hypothetical protein